MKDTRRNELPEECWELILNRLALDNDDSNLRSPSLVCKQFLSITDRLRRKLVAKNLKFYRNSCEGLCGALQRFRNLEHIELYGRELDINPTIWKTMGSSMMINLKTLRRRRFESFGDQDLVAIADALPWLEELDIKVNNRHFPNPELSDSSNVTDAGIEVISRKLLGLRKIDISGNHGCSDQSLVALSSNCVGLQEIRCTNCHVTKHGICFVLWRSTNLISLQAEYSSSPDSRFTFDDSKNYGRALRVLDLCAYEDQDRLLCSIAKVIIPLEKLVLQGDNDLSLHGLSTLLCACPSLKHLELRHISFINDDSMRDLCPYLPNVASIVLIQCYITIAIFFILAKACPTLSEIKLLSGSISLHYRIGSLDLGHNSHMNDELLKKVVFTFPNLHSLDLRGRSELTIEGIEEVLKCCSQIKYLEVSKRMEVYAETFSSYQIQVRYL